MSAPLVTRLKADLAAARKRKDKERVLVLGTLLSEVRNREIDQGADLSDDDVLQTVSRAIKQRREAADQMREGGRDELAAREEAQAAILQAYLPEPFTEDEVRVMIREIVADGADQMGAVMGRLMPRLRGRFDGREANRLVREELGG